MATGDDTGVEGNDLEQVYSFLHIFCVFCFELHSTYDLVFYYEGKGDVL